MSKRSSIFFIEKEVIHVIAFPAEGDEQKAVVATLLEGLSISVPVSSDPKNPDPNVIAGVMRTSWAMLGNDVLYACLNIHPYRTTPEYLAHCEVLLLQRGFANMNASV